MGLFTPRLANHGPGDPFARPRHIDRRSVVARLADRVDPDRGARSQIPAVARTAGRVAATRAHNRAVTGLARLGDALTAELANAGPRIPPAVAAAEERRAARQAAQKRGAK